jgi:hypothetical protein
MIVYLAWNRSTLHQFGERARLSLPTVGEDDGKQEGVDVRRPGRTQHAPATGVYPVSDTFASAASPCPVARRRMVGRLTVCCVWTLQRTGSRQVQACSKTRLYASLSPTLRPVYALRSSAEPHTHRPCIQRTLSPPARPNRGLASGREDIRAEPTNDNGLPRVWIPESRPRLCESGCCS